MSDAPGLTTYELQYQVRVVGENQKYATAPILRKGTLVYLASEVEARERAMKDWLQDFIEANGCTEQGDGRWRCHQCEQYVDPSGDFAHWDDCNIVTAQALLGRLR